MNKIMAPVQLSDSWSLYDFDMEEKFIHVLDPYYEGATEEALQMKHGIPAMSLLLGMRVCDLHLGYVWQIIESEWTVKFHSNIHPCCSLEDTAVYMYYYAKHFNGLIVPNLDNGLTPRELTITPRNALPCCSF